MELYFKSHEHQKLFTKYLAVLNVVPGDREYTSALYLLSATGKPMEKYFDDGGIKFPDLLEKAQVWSSAEKALVNMAAHLFNSGYYKAVIDDVFYSLDEENYKVTIESLNIRYKR